MAHRFSGFSPRLVEKEMAWWKNLFISCLPEEKLRDRGERRERLRKKEKEREEGKEMEKLRKRR